MHYHRDDLWLWCYIDMQLINPIDSFSSTCLGNLIKAIHVTELLTTKSLNAKIVFLVSKYKSIVVMNCFMLPRHL